MTAIVPQPQPGNEDGDNVVSESAVDKPSTT